MPQAMVLSLGCYVGEQTNEFGVRLAILDDFNQSRRAFNYHMLAGNMMFGDDDDEDEHEAAQRHHHRLLGGRAPS